MRNVGYINLNDSFRPNIFNNVIDNREKAYLEMLNFRDCQHLYLDIKQMMTLYLLLHAHNGKTLQKFVAGKMISDKSIEDITDTDVNHIGSIVAKHLKAALKSRSLDIKHISAHMVELVFKIGTNNGAVNYFEHMDITCSPKKSEPLKTFQSEFTF